MDVCLVCRHEPNPAPALGLICRHHCALAGAAIRLQLQPANEPALPMLPMHTRVRAILLVVIIIITYLHYSYPDTTSKQPVSLHRYALNPSLSFYPPSAPLSPFSLPLSFVSGIRHQTSDDLPGSLAQQLPDSIFICCFVHAQGEPTYYTYNWPGSAGRLHQTAAIY